jgi:hypothetical protein
VIDEEDLRHFAAGSAYMAHILNQYRTDRPSSLFIRYEEDIFDLPKLVEKMAAHFGVPITDNERDGLVIRHGIDRHRKEADGIVPSSPDAPWMKGHIHDGAIGCWKRFTPEPLQDLFTELLFNDLSHWGYV